MVMIRCPECGQRALDVASACPKCGHVLIQNPLETHDWGSLRACGRCGKHIERDATLCPYCGHHVRAARLAWRIGLGTAAAVVAVAAGIGLWRSGVIASLRETARPARPPAAAPQPPAPAPVPAVPVGDSVPPDTTRVASMAAAPDPANTDSGGQAPAVAVQPPVRPPVPPVQNAAPQPRDLVTRWTLEWANVRAARSVEATVVQVLPPGRALEVREMRQGWWAVYAEGAVVGYIANSVLTNTPPG